MASQSIICPSCKEKNNPAYLKCWKCSNEFAPADILSRAEVKTNSINQKTISHVLLILFLFIPGLCLTLISANTILHCVHRGQIFLVPFVLGLIGFLIGTIAIAIYLYFFKKNFLKRLSEEIIFKKFKVIFLGNIPFILLKIVMLEDLGKAIGDYFSAVHEYPFVILPLQLVSILLFFMLILAMVDMIFVLRQKKLLSLGTSYFVVAHILFSIFFPPGELFVPIYLFLKANQYLTAMKKNYSITKD